MKERRGKDSGGFDQVLKHESLILAYCRRRGSRDPEGISAEAMSLAWQQREKLNLKDCRPWLLTTARNLLFDEYRARNRSFPLDPAAIDRIDDRQEPEFEIDSLDPEINQALASLSPEDQEAVLLVAWEDLTPTQAAKTMGISAATFRVRLHRARRRMRTALEQPNRNSHRVPDRPLEEKT